LRVQTDGTCNTKRSVFFDVTPLQTSTPRLDLSAVAEDTFMTDDSLENLRRSALAALPTLEARDRELSQVLTGDCAQEISAYLASVREARARFELLEHKLLQEFLDRRAD
jgi:hypothetical protein